MRRSWTHLYAWTRSTSMCQRRTCMPPAWSAALAVILILTPCLSSGVVHLTSHVARVREAALLMHSSHERGAWCPPPGGFVLGKEDIHVDHMLTCATFVLSDTSLQDFCNLPFTNDVGALLSSLVAHLRAHFDGYASRQDSG